MIQKSGFLENFGCIGIIVLVLLIASLVVAGCTQSSSDNSVQSAAIASTADNSGSPAPAPGTGTASAGSYSNGQHTGGNFLNNATRIAAAAQTLRVSTDALTTALTSPSQGRLNITDAAAQLSAASGTTITPTQLMAALGMHAGGTRNGSWQGSGRTAAGNVGNAQTGNTASGS